MSVLKTTTLTSRILLRVEKGKGIQMERERGRAQREERGERDYGKAKTLPSNEKCIHKVR